MRKFGSIALIAFLMISCSENKKNNTLIKSVGNPKSDVKAILFYTDGIVSVTTFNVSIVPHDSELSNSDTANIFSYTCSDTIKVNKDSLVKIVWKSPNQLKIYHPAQGTFWKNETEFKHNGTLYSIEYSVK